MNTASYLCSLLEKHAVEYVFGLFGDIETDFAHAIASSSIRWVGVHNEKSGGFMADIYARVSGKTGVVFTTLGPGATNLTSALANATQDRSPLVALSDQVPSKDFRIDTHQFVDLERAFHPNTGITKYTAVVHSAKDLPDIMERAFAIAQEEPKGAVHISIPHDIFGMDTGTVPAHKIPGREQKKVKSTYSYAQLVRLLSTGEQGLVIAGGPIERSGSREAFVTFIERFNLPVLTTFRGKNAIPTDHPNCLGTISRHLADAVKTIIAESAYVLTVGYEYNEGINPSLWNVKKDAVYNISSYDNHVDGIFTPPSLFGNLPAIFADLSSEKRPAAAVKRSYKALKLSLQETVKDALNVNIPSLHPQRITDAVNAVFKNAIIVCDVGLNKYYAGLLLHADRDRRVLFSNGQSAMAFSSGALGAKLADPRKDVVVLVGDGGFLMDMQEVLTTIENRQPVTWIIFNNGGLGLIEHAQLKNGRSSHGVHFTKVFFKQLAESFGLTGKRVKKTDDLTKILQDIRKKQQSAIVDVPVVYTPLRKSY